MYSLLGFVYGGRKFVYSLLEFVYRKGKFVYNFSGFVYGKGKFVCNLSGFVNGERVFVVWYTVGVWKNNCRLSTLLGHLGTDIIKVERFKDSKAFTSYLRSAPCVETPIPSFRA